MLSHFMRNNEHNKALKIANIILKIEPLNEDVFKIEMMMLQKLGRINQAKMKFHIFEKEYMNAYNKKLDIKDFIK